MRLAMIMLMVCLILFTSCGLNEWAFGKVGPVFPEFEGAGTMYCLDGFLDHIPYQERLKYCGKCHYITDGEF